MLRRWDYGVAPVLGCMAMLYVPAYPRAEPRDFRRRPSVRRDARVYSLTYAPCLLTVTPSSPPPPPISRCSLLPFTAVVFVAALLRTIRNKYLWLAVSLLVYTFGISGGVYDIIRNPAPFMMKPDGTFMWFHPQVRCCRQQCRSPPPGL